MQDSGLYDMRPWQFIILGALIVATGVYAVNGENWQTSRAACKEYREWVRFQNTRPRTPVPYEDTLKWMTIIQEHGCKEIEIEKSIAGSAGQKDLTWPERGGRRISDQ